MFYLYVYDYLVINKIISRLLYENSIAKTTNQGQNEYVKNNAFKYTTVEKW